MRLADDVRKCVVFIGIGLPGSDIEMEDPMWGTGFVVSTGDTAGIYLVTARHIVQFRLDHPVDIRFNTKDGRARLLHIPRPEWLFHPTDNSIDVALLHLAGKFELPTWADCLPIYTDPTILADARFASKNIGPGDLVYTVGLWKFLSGKRRNQAFVHTGHIGLISDDDFIPVRDWMSSDPKQTVLIEAYLVEGEPLNGSSGSPVFVRRSIMRPIPKGGDKTPLEGWIHGSVWLLGLMHGSWHGRPGVDYEIPDADNEKVLVSRGVNVVVPSMKIREVIFRDPK